MSGKAFLRDLAVAAKRCDAQELAKLAASAALGAERELLDVRRAAPAPQLACGAGCAWCCHVLVVVSVAEVARIVRHLRSTLETAAYEALHQRCVSLAHERQSMTAAQWNRQRRPCPLLGSSRCSIYNVRPFACRGMNSVDSSACEREYVNRAGKLPIYVPQQQLMGYTREAIVHGLVANGGPGLLELIPALAVGMQLPPDRFLDRQAWLTAEYRGFAPIDPENQE